MDRLADFCLGLYDSVCWWTTALNSRSFRSVVRKLSPVYVVSFVLGAIAHYGGFDRVWYYIWVLPVYGIAAFMQTRLLQTIGTPDARRWSLVASELVVGIAFSFAIFVQAWVICLGLELVLGRIPLTIILQSGVNVVTVAFAVSFAAWDWKMIVKFNQTLPQRIEVVERDWAYALGYGVLTSMIYHALPDALGLIYYHAAVLVLMMHWMMLSRGFGAEAQRHRRLRVFAFAKYMIRTALN